MLNPYTHNIHFQRLKNKLNYGILNIRRYSIFNTKQDSRAQDTARRTTRQQILLKADIICSTLAGAGHESLDSFQFDLIIVDEAAQAIELSSLIPLKNGVAHCVMVGDPQQLPPTVISKEVSFLTLESV